MQTLADVTLLTTAVLALRLPLFSLAAACSACVCVLPPLFPNSVARLHLPSSSPSRCTFLAHILDSRGNTNSLAAKTLVKVFCYEPPVALTPN